MTDESGSKTGERPQGKADRFDMFFSQTGRICDPFHLQFELIVYD